MSGQKRRRPQNERVGSSEKSVAASLGHSSGLRVTANQLCELWSYDNECGRKYMKGCPMRSCTLNVRAVDCDKSAADTGLGLTIEEMTFVKLSIQNMWEKAGGLFEIFINKWEENEGYRLRVRNDLAVKLIIKEQDAIPCGWVAEIPADLRTAHVYKRSCVEPSGYLGGPVSYMNWCTTNKQRVNVLQSLSHNVRHICKMWTKGYLAAGTELRWDYGCSQYMPDSGVWLKDECCQVSTVGPSDLKRHEGNEMSRKFIYRELCVLCGFPFSVANKENRAQRKQHFVGLHADFLGSKWDGIGSYEQEPVHTDELYCKADELNYLLGALKKMNWNVLPACKVFTQEELESFGDNAPALLNEYGRRRDILKAGGTLVLRGSEVPSTLAHFKPIEPRQWKVITWKNNVKPVPGRYAVPSHTKDAHELRLSAALSTFCEKNLLVEI